MSFVSPSKALEFMTAKFPRAVAACFPRSNVESSVWSWRKINIHVTSYSIIEFYIVEQLFLPQIMSAKLTCAFNLEENIY